MSMKNITAAIALAFFSCTSLCAQSFWTPVNEASVGRDLFAASRSQRPDNFKLFRLDDAAFKNYMRLAPSEKAVPAANSAFIISFPDADGQLKQFRVVDAPVMHADLAARYPGINSYAGVGIEDPTATIRFSVSPEGVNAVVFSTTKSSVYVDKLDADYYRVLARTDVGPEAGRRFECLTNDPGLQRNADPANRPTDADDGILRTYRLALCATGQFSQHFLNGTETDDAQRKAKVIAAQNAHMTRANAVFERDFNVRLVLVANNDAVIFLDGATDPWGNLNSATQTTCDNIIGDANYDIGHVEHKAANNGNAGCIGCVCTSGAKGSGFTSYSNPSLLEFFIIDYLTHEMGHQLGGNHTFTFNFEGTIAQVEPGSGTTIMGYAGITGATDVQPHSDEYFHARSIQQVTQYIKSAAGACAQTTNTGNAIPTVNAGSSFTIPHSTPFQLSGSGSDANAGDVLSYCWEQINQWSGGSSTFPSATATSGPQFRSYMPVSVPSRVIPKLSSILDGTNANQWEVLPSVARTLNFRLTVKDNRPGGGANRSADMVVTVNAASGPFAVTAPNTAVSWGSGSTQTVTWSVNNTTSAPVSCANVNILLSTDGGQTFPITLAANTPNDGSQDITVPNNPGATNRIKVEAAGNIFFDISNTNFTISVPIGDFQFDNPAAVHVACAGPNTASATLATTFSAPFASNITLSASGQPAGTTVSFNPATVAPGGSSIVTISGLSALQNGTYSFTVTGNGGSITRTRVLTFIVDAGAIPVITQQPVSQPICETGNVTFTVAATGITAYQWQLSTNGGGIFTDIATNATGSSYTVNNATAAQNGHVYRVRLTGQCNVTNSGTATLTVNARPTVTLAAAPYQELFPGLSTTLTATINPAPTGFNISWFRNGVVVPGVTGTSYTVDVTKLGEYRVDIVNPTTGCNNQSNLVTIGDSVSSRLFVYPSPNDGQFTVAYHNPGSSTTQRSITVYDARGAKVKSIQHIPINAAYNLVPVNIKPAGKGIYYIVLGDVNGKVIARGSIVVQ
jgi:hypothetical protein